MIHVLHNIAGKKIGVVSGYSFGENLIILRALYVASDLRTRMCAKAVTESMDGELTAVTNITKVLAELLDISVLVDQNSMGQAPVIIFAIVIQYMYR